jgi:hypothetical protein
MIEDRISVICSHRKSMSNTSLKHESLMESSYMLFVRLFLFIFFLTERERERELVIIV